MSHSRFVVPLVVAILVSSAYGHASVPCVETFDEFEKAVLANPDNVQALVREFYTPNQPIPLSVHVVYHIKLSNGRDTIFSTDPRCPAGKEMWLWVPSPVFIFMEPSKLNLCAFRTLNFFKLWTPREAHIYVPIVCNSTSRFNFLNELTSRIQIYAAAHLSAKDVNPGYVLKGCGDEALTTLLPTTLQNNGQSMQELSEILISIYLAGNFALIFGGLLAIWVLLHRYGKTVTNTNPQPSFDNYGLFWGCVVLSVVANGLLISHTSHFVKLYMNSGVYHLIAMGWSVLVQLLAVVLASLIVAIWFSCKLSLDIPSILWLLAPLCCNRAKPARKIVVQCLSLWSLIQCLLHVVCYIPFLGLALLALPSTVLFTLLIYIVAAVCALQFLAITFTFCKMEKKEQGVKKYCGCCTRCTSFVLNMFQVLAFALLCSSFLCYSILISAVGALANYGITSWSSPHSVFSIVATSLFPVALVWIMREIGTLWLQHRTNSPPEDENENPPISQATTKQEEVSMNEVTPGPQDAAKEEEANEGTVATEDDPLLAI